MPQCTSCSTVVKRRGARFCFRCGSRLIALESEAGMRMSEDSETDCSTSESNDEHQTFVHRPADLVASNFVHTQQALGSSSAPSGFAPPGIAQQQVPVYAWTWTAWFDVDDAPASTISAYLSANPPILLAPFPRPYSGLPIRTGGLLRSDLTLFGWTAPPPVSYEHSPPGSMRNEYSDPRSRPSVSPRLHSTRSFMSAHQPQPSPTTPYQTRANRQSFTSVREVAEAAPPSASFVAPPRRTASAAVVASPNNYYAILGVPPTASPAELRTAYMKKAVLLHPDRNGGDVAAERQFQLVTEAYSVLSRPQAREHYDSGGVAAVSAADGAAASSPHALLLALFGHDAWADTYCANEVATMLNDDDDGAPSGAAAGGRERERAHATHGSSSPWDAGDREPRVRSAGAQYDAAGPAGAHQREPRDSTPGPPVTRGASSDARARARARVSASASVPRLSSALRVRLLALAAMLDAHGEDAAAAAVAADVAAKARAPGGPSLLYHVAHVYITCGRVVRGRALGAERLVAKAAAWGHDLKHSARTLMRSAEFVMANDDPEVEGGAGPPPPSATAVRSATMLLWTKGLKCVEMITTAVTKGALQGAGAAQIGPLTGPQGGGAAGAGAPSNVFLRAYEQQQHQLSTSQPPVAPVPPHHAHPPTAGQPLPPERSSPVPTGDSRPSAFGSMQSSHGGLHHGANSNPSTAPTAIPVLSGHAPSLAVPGAQHQSHAPGGPPAGSGVPPGGHCPPQAVPQAGGQRGRGGGLMQSVDRFVDRILAPRDRDAPAAAHPGVAGVQQAGAVGPRGCGTAPRGGGLDAGIGGLFRSMTAVLGGRDDPPPAANKRVSMPVGGYGHGQGQTPVAAQRGSRRGDYGQSVSLYGADVSGAAGGSWDVGSPSSFAYQGGSGSGASLPRSSSTPAFDGAHCLTGGGREASPRGPYSAVQPPPGTYGGVGVGGAARNDTHGRPMVRAESLTRGRTHSLGRDVGERGASAGAAERGGAPGTPGGPERSRTLIGLLAARLPSISFADALMNPREREEEPVPPQSPSTSGTPGAPPTPSDNAALAKKQRLAMANALIFLGMQYSKAARKGKAPVGALPTDDEIAAQLAELACGADGLL